MAFIGNQPTAVPLTSSQLADGLITTAKLASTAVTNPKVDAAAITTDKLNLISTASVPAVTAKGTPSVSDGYIQLNCEQNSHGIKLKSPPHSAAQSYTLTFPSTAPTNGTFLQTDGSGVLSFASAGGITEADQWRITANKTGITSASDITANWERNDSTGSGYIGTGMTQSSGIFTFPSTGYYLIQFISNMQSTTATGYMSNIIYVTTNNSTYVDVCNSDTNAFQGSVYSSLLIEYIFDVTSTANCKIKFAVQASDSTNFLGSSTVQKTGVTFIRLGDT